jgi:NAD(P)-dependent dehydrogenase (short-subunit alcohol dehydrogenase family)
MPVDSLPATFIIRTSLAQQFSTLVASALALNRLAGRRDRSRADAKVAVVTGGGSGIGRAIAKKFAAQGVIVRVLDIRLADAEATCREIVSQGAIASAHLCDVTNQQQVKAVFQQIFERERLSILVNNAGISHIGTVESTTEEEFDRVVRVNVKGFYHCMQACIGHMKNRGGGVILNLASTAGSAGLSYRFAYSMSKGAVIAMTYSVARDYLSANIRCNCISPARVNTSFVDECLRKICPGHQDQMFEKLSTAQPMGRMGEPDEVASLAWFLCSDEARFITGVDYPLDGGFFNLRG